MRVLSTLLLILTAGLATAETPNVVVILADDMGYGDVRALNPTSAIPTPSLDRLAEEGMLFTDAHTPSSVCTPTRYGLLTGRYAWRGRLEAGRKALEATLSAGHPVYGVTTGVGMDAARRITDPQGFAYQIIRQHGCGLGDYFNPAEGRAILFTRLVSLAKGYSAVRPTLLQALCDLIDRDVYRAGRYYNISSARSWVMWITSKFTMNSGYSFLNVW